MKRFLTILVSLCLLTVCARAEAPREADGYALRMYGMTVSEISDGLRIGSVASGFSAEEEQAAWRQVLSEELGCDLGANDIVRVDVPSLADAIMMLSVGKLDIMELPEACARYVASRNGSVGYLDDPAYACELSMIFAAGSEELRNAANRAIADMRQDGTLDALKTRYIDSAAETDDPEPVQIARTDAGSVLRVGVSGCMPPYDYTTPAGEPAGYNIAFLSELAGRMQTGIQLVSVAGNAYQAALATGVIDAYFCYFTEGCYGDVYTSNIFGEQEALADRLLFSDSYAREPFCILLSRERAERGAQARSEAADSAR